MRKRDFEHAELDADGATGAQGIVFWREGAVGGAQR